MTTFGGASFEAEAVGLAISLGGAGGAGGAANSGMCIAATADGALGAPPAACGSGANNEGAAITAAKDKQTMLIARRADGITTSFS